MIPDAHKKAGLAQGRHGSFAELRNELALHIRIVTPDAVLLETQPLAIEAAPVKEQFHARACAFKPAATRHLYGATVTWMR
jgi:hypothetical protein